MVDIDAPANDRLPAAYKLIPAQDRPRARDGATPERLREHLRLVCGTGGALRRFGRD
jgi:hypothetical protein